jgi:hypothetical protein
MHLTVHCHYQEVGKKTREHSIIQQQRRKIHKIQHKCNCKSIKIGLCILQFLVYVYPITTIEESVCSTKCISAAHVRVFYAYQIWYDHYFIKFKQNFLAYSPNHSWPILKVKISHQPNSQFSFCTATVTCHLCVNKFTEFKHRGAQSAMCAGYWPISVFPPLKGI